MRWADLRHTGKAGAVWSVQPARRQTRETPSPSLQTPRRFRARRQRLAPEGTRGPELNRQVLSRGNLRQAWQTQRRRRVRIKPRETRSWLTTARATSMAPSGSKKLAVRDSDLSPGASGVPSRAAWDSVRQEVRRIANFEALASARQGRRGAPGHAEDGQQTQRARHGTGTLTF